MAKQWVNEHQNEYCFLDNLIREFIRRDEEYHEERKRSFEKNIKRDKDYKAKNEKLEEEICQLNMNQANDEMNKWEWKRDCIGEIKELKDENQQLKTCIRKNREARFEIIKLLVQQEFYNTNLTVDIKSSLGVLATIDCKHN